MLDHLIQVIGDDEASADQEIIDSCIDSQPGELIYLCRIHIVRIYKDGKRPLSLFFPGQQGLVNKLLHSLLPLW
jgi:hypothetical protein